MLQQEPSLCYSVYRKGLREDSINYRPIGVTSVPGNVLMIILVKIERHLKEQCDHQAQLT